MIENKVTLITGVSSGIGRATAQMLAERGALVLGTVREVGHTQPIAGVELICVDVTDPGSINTAVETALQKADRIDILINNAGYSIAGALEEPSVDEAHLLFETNSLASCA
jgi:NAD(P)-dependent dehydrogenase (short-subunit alcohol dehydrogenase family)